MPFDFPARVQKQHGETFTVGVKVRMAGNVQPPIIGGFVGCLAMLQAVRRRTFAQGGHFVFIWAGGKLERFHQRFKSGKSCGGMRSLPCREAQTGVRRAF